MLFSVGLIILVATLMGFIANRFHLPSLLGFLITGMLLGRYGLNLVDESIYMASASLRQVALIVILTRAGLSLNLADLKLVGRPAILLSFLPASFEILAVTALGPLFFNMSILEASILGCILAAVSPAVVVPKMLDLLKSKIGNHQVPKLIMAGASLDDIFVLVLFSILMKMYEHGQANLLGILRLPIAILLGLLLGLSLGMAINKLFKIFHIRDTLKLLIILSIYFITLSLIESQNMIPISGMLAVLTSGMTLLYANKDLAGRLAGRFSKVWVFCEIFLFVLVGLMIDVKLLLSGSITALVFIIICMIFRGMGIQISLIKSPLSKKERLFTTIAYMPKATVQAAIGSIPLAKGLASGEDILLLSVMVIMITAPLSAYGMDLTSKKLLG